MYIWGMYCPVDFVSINENVARLNAFQVVVLMLLWFLTGFVIIPLFLILDFGLRSLNYGKYSLLNRVSLFLVKVFSIPEKPVDRAPKRFAALVGCLFSFAIVLLSLIGFGLGAEVLSGVLLLFASLEAFFRFCAGCHVYSLYKRLSQ